MDALRQWIWSDLDDIMVGTWMLCGNGYGLIWTLSWLAHGCSAETTAGTRFSAAKSRKHRKDRCVRCLHVRASTTPRKTRQARRFRLQSPRNTVNTDVVGVCAARVNSTSVPKTRNPKKWYYTFYIRELRGFRNFGGGRVPGILNFQNPESYT